MSGQPSELSAEKQALLALRGMRRRVEELESSAVQPIAIVGMACRMPGGVFKPEDLWKLLSGKRDAVGEIPRERVDLNGIFEAYPAKPGKSYSRWAGLMDAPEHFDAEFFGISPREAMETDPQQRLLLEATWEAFEDAGIDPKSLAGQPCGVFVGISASEYGRRPMAPEQLTAYTLQGGALNATAGRIAYSYGLNGPAMAIDTACSSSLVAVDRACRSLREGESTLAIAAGVNLLAIADNLIVASQWGMLSPTGKIRAFDSSADGFVRGEGCGVVVLKRLRDAESNGDRVLGVILGSAVNQDGASSGLTVPNGLAQQALVREAHRRSGIEPSQVGYVEAHGTGTTLGDPIEAEALGAVFAGRREKLAIGSVKTNLGHLESAAGIAGLIKLVLSLEHGRIPAQLHWTGPSEHVRWADLPLEVVTEARAWEPIGGRRIGGVSSFGLSGTNAHVVVEGYKRAEPTEGSDEGPEALVLSARTEAALRELAEKYAGYLETETEWGWREICATAGVGRAAFAERLAVVAASRREAAAKLRGWLEGQNNDVHRGHVGAGHRGGTALSADASPATVAAQFVAGNGTDWRRRGAGLRRAALPTYAFQRERYWVEAGPRQGRGMLGRRLEQVAGTRGVFETLLTSAGWIGEHSVEGHAVLPATGHVELMLEAGTEIVDGGCRLEELVLEDVLLEARLTVDGQRKVQTVVEPPSGGRSRVRVYAAAGDDWERVSEGWLSRIVATDAESQPQADVAAIQARLHEMPAGEPFYRAMADRGVSFGERFRGVRRLWAGDGEALGEIAVTEAAGEDWQTAPWWLDACLQTAGAAAGDQLYLPLGIDRVRFHAPPSQTGPSKAAPSQTAWSHLQSRQSNENTIAADLDIFSTYGDSIAKLNGIRFRKIEMKTSSTGIFRTQWTVYQPIATQKTEGHWLVLVGEENNYSVSNELQAAGATCSILSDASYSLSHGSTSFHERVAALRQQLRDRIASKGPLSGVLDLRAIAGETGPEPMNDADPSTACTEVLALLQAILHEQILLTSGIWLATRAATRVEGVSPSGCAVWGLARTARLEFPELNLKCVDLDANAPARELIPCLQYKDATEIAVRSGSMFAPEVTEATGWESAANVELRAATSGLIEDLREIAAERRSPGEDEIEIAVEAHGVNFRDVMNSLGMLPGFSQQLGGECAGRVVRAGAGSAYAEGDTVFAFAPGSFRKYVTVRSANAAPIPAGVTLSQAASLPVVYLTALYGLDRLAHLQAGESVLIHAAAGGLGQAAVQVAAARGAQIYATAGSNEKREWLRAHGIEHVFSSRTPAFADELMSLTSGRGVDVVLNSLTGELAQKSLGVVAHGGRFLEVGKRETISASEAQRLRPDVRHFQYDLGTEAERDPSLVPTLLAELLKLFESGALATLPVTEFADAREAFRYMAQAKHTGKIVVIRPDALRVRADGTYLITGGCGGLGLIFAQALASRGARHIVLMGRSAPNPNAVTAIERMRSHGCEITVVKADVADRASLQDALPDGCQLRGVIHAAGVLDDRSLLEQSDASLRAVMHPKWDGAWNLHIQTLRFPLDFFVLFSSASAMIGSKGQANYAAANATMDALARYRQAQGLCALSVQWGPWNAAGMAEHLTLKSENSGMGRIEAAAGVDAVGSLLKCGDAVAAVLSIASRPLLMERMRRGAVPESAHAISTVETSRPENRKRRLVEELIEASPAERVAILREHLRQQTMEILSLPERTRIDEDVALHDLGLDSLMAVELRNALVTSLERQWPPTLALDFPTLRVMTDHLLTEMFGKVVETDADLAMDVADLSEAEAEAQLLKELGRQGYGALR